jgi:predicted transporter
VAVAAAAAAVVVGLRLGVAVGFQGRQVRKFVTSAPSSAAAFLHCRYFVERFFESVAAVPSNTQSAIVLSFYSDALYPCFAATRTLSRSDGLIDIPVKAT